MAKQAKVDIDYLFKIPEKVPRGKVLVHNRVPPTRRVGDRGFRIWLDDVSATKDKLTRCECDWAPEVGRHYRVASVENMRKTSVRDKPRQTTNEKRSR